MLRGFYFSQVEKSGLGPHKKIEGQIQTFSKAGIDLELIESPFQESGIVRGNFLLRQIVCRLPFTYVYSRHIYEKRFEQADVYYVRFLAGDRAFVRFLRELKRHNPGGRIIMELADYPTTWYMNTNIWYRMVYFPIWIKDKLAARKYHKYVDRIAMLKDYKQVFGIPVIQFTNGIVVDEVKRRKAHSTPTVKIIAVAAMCVFHGYDRIIEGIHNYYANGGQREIELHMVGGKNAPGNELAKYKALCTKYHLEDKVFFYGEKRGQELDEVYDLCNLAVSSLGMHRIGYQSANSLKIREYLSKGLPIIGGGKVDLFDKNKFDYYYECPSDDTAIDIKRIIEFYDRIYQKPEDYGQVNDIIYNYAKRYCDMSAALKPVIDYMKE